MTAAPDFADWLAITNLKARYCRTLDSKDWDGYGALFVDDIIIDTTASGGPRMVGRENALASIRAALDTAKTAHHVHMPEIAIDGDQAHAIWPMHDQLIWSDGRRLNGAGHYHERYVRHDDGWKIAESRLTRLFVDMQSPMG